MTPKQKEAIERARKIPARFIEIDAEEHRVTRFTAAKRIEAAMTLEDRVLLKRQRENALARKWREENAS